MKKQQFEKHKNAIAAAFKGKITPTDINATQRIRAVMATVLVMVPPFVYIALLLWGFFVYLSGLIKYFPAFYPEAGVLHTLLYSILVLLLTSILAFLVRPLLSLQGAEPLLDLDEQDEPSVFYLARTLAERMGSDAINGVQISAELVVDVYYRSPRAFFERELTVKLGLPLFGSVKIDQMAAMLAHQYSYYQDPQLRVCYSVIRAVRAWFYRVVNNEDKWSARVDKIAERYASMIARPLLLPIYFGISLVSRLFQLFLSLVENFSNGFFHELALQADKVQTSFLGGKGFKDLMNTIVEVDQAYQASLEKLLSRESVPENMASLIRLNYARNQGRDRQLIELAPSDHFNSWHLLPSPFERVKHLEVIDGERAFVLPNLFEQLFFDIETVGTRISEAFYLKHNVSPDKSAVESSQTELYASLNLEADLEMLLKFTSGVFRREIIWQVPELDKFAQLPQSKAVPFLAKVIRGIRQNLPEFNKCVQLLDEYYKEQQTYHLYQWLLKNGCKNRPPAEEMEGVKYFIKDFNEKFLGSLENYRKSFGARVAVALALGRSSNAFGPARKLALLMLKLGQLENSVAESTVRAATLRQLIARRSQGEHEHGKTISRFTKMNVKVIGDLENVLGRFPASLLGQRVASVLQKRLSIDQLSAADYEVLALDRHAELVSCYTAFNVVISAKLAKFVESVEGKQGIEPVAKVSVSAAGHNPSTKSST